ncbi:olfactory receptor 6C4-like [Rhinophrynus dorsalis]
MILILTDYKNLTYLSEVKRLSPRQAIWALFLSIFNYVVSYLPGIKNIKADSLSLQFGTDSEEECPLTPIIPSDRILASIRTSITSPLGEEILAAQASAPVDKPESLHTKLLETYHSSREVGHIESFEAQNIPALDEHFSAALLHLAYMITLTGDFVIITLVTTSQRLQTPMYYFLKHLSMSEILFTTNIVPNMLCIILEAGRSMSVGGCITQFYIYIASGSVESLLLTVMSYDRYLAICNPLRYNYLMNNRLCSILAFCSWLMCFLIVLITIVLICQLEFCDSNVIDHFFCDFAPIVELSCSDTSLVRTEVLVLSIPTVISTFLFILVTYMCISITIFRISSSTGRQKAFSTCSAHLASVCSYYGPLIIIYLVPYRKNSLNVNKFLSTIYTVMTPLFNPIIYSLRNQEIRNVLSNFLKISRS